MESRACPFWRRPSLEKLKRDLGGDDDRARIARERQVRPVEGSAARRQHVQDTAGLENCDQVRIAAVHVVQITTGVLRMIQGVAELSEQFESHTLGDREALHQA